MSKSIIKVNGLGKRYRIGAKREAYGNFRETILNAMKAPLRNFRRLKKLTNFEGGAMDSTDDTIWALKDVSFEVNEGEVIGIIGRNGSGKSTLLKILSRITEPTEGYAEIGGRVSSLLEVGTGFHKELTGRENIYLNGAILGMRKREIDRKFDEIVAFSEIEKFLDTPVKHYSSGMYVRLAFAVAAHLEPEILLVDEVLAVGDAAFQKKCLGKMGDLAKGGRTVLFVSHNMGAILNLCDRAILLETGKIIANAKTQMAVQHYLENNRVCTSGDLRFCEDRRGLGRVRFTQILLEDDNGNSIKEGISGESLVIKLEYQSKEKYLLKNCRISVVISDNLDQVLFNCASEVTANDFPINLPPNGIIRCLIPKLPLSESQYFISLFLEVNREIEDWIQGATVLNVIDGDFYGTGKLYPEGWQGKGVLVPHKWIIESQIMVKY